MNATVAKAITTDIPRVLNELRQMTTDGVLSVYLDTTPSRTLGNGVVAAFHDGCKALQANDENPVDTSVNQLEAAIRQVDAFLTERFTISGSGVAIFATGRDDDVLATVLQGTPRDVVAWSERAVIEPLVSALDDHERIAVLLFDKRRSRLFTVNLGQIEESQAFVDDVPGKQETGEWFALSRKRFERHHEDHVLRHVKRTVGVISAELLRRPFDRLIVGGPDEAIALLLGHLPRKLQQKLIGTLTLPLYATDAEVLNAARIVAEAIERAEESAAVASLIESSHTPHVTIGFESTLGALAEGRVHRLFIANDLDRDGRYCDNCGRLSATFTHCPLCAQTLRRVVDLKECAIEEAREKGTHVEIVSGEAARRLMEHGGLAAVTRY